MIDPGKDYELQKARADDLAVQVARWEAEEIDRASCCMANEKRADKLEAGIRALLRHHDDPEKEPHYDGEHTCCEQAEELTKLLEDSK